MYNEHYNSIYYFLCHFYQYVLIVNFVFQKSLLNLVNVLYIHYTQIMNWLENKYCSTARMYDYMCGIEGTMYKKKRNKK